MSYRFLGFGEVVQIGDETWPTMHQNSREPVWGPVSEWDVGQYALFPQFPNRLYRTKIHQVRDWGEPPVWML